MKAAITALVRKKTLFALVLALTIFGAVYGFAATLNVGTNQLSAGNAAVASCQASGTPTGTYSVAYDSSITGYKVAGVTVTGTSGTALGTIAGTVPVGGGSLALTPGSVIDAKNVIGVSVAING
jgi:hypothetical protein